MQKITIKPLSVNKCWQGKRFKTNEYKAYEVEVLSYLKPLRIPKGIKLHLLIDVGFSNKNADLDNIVKPFQDILQKKYSFNDSQIYKLEVTKQIVKKGKEYVNFEIKELCKLEKDLTANVIYESRT